MKNINSLDIHDITRAISKLLYRFHIVIFVTVVIGGMAFVMFLLNQTITRATDTSQVMAPPPARFDQDTIDRLNKLEASNSLSDIKLPSGRINPFSE